MGLAGAVLALGILVLILGWGAGVDLFARVFPGLPAMVPGTAISLTGLAAAQLFALHEDQIARQLAGGMAACLSAYGIFRIAGLLAGGAPLEYSGDAMSLATMIGILLVGLGQLSRSLGHGPKGIWTDTTGLLLCLLALDGFLLSPEGFARTGLLAGMAAHTAVGLMWLFLAGLFAGPRGSWLNVVLGPERSSQQARRILPLAVIAPILLAKTATYLTEHGLLDISIRISGLAVLLVAFGCYLVIRNARQESAEEAQARLAETRLKQVLDGLDTAVFVFGANRRLRMSNRKANELCGGAGAALDWLFKTQFHSPQDRSALAPDQNPAARLLAGAADEDQYAGCIAGGRTERILRFTSTQQADPASGQPLTILSVVDETESWNTRAFLGQQERLDLIAQLSGGIAHDISNILGAIQLAADTGALGDEPARMRRSLSMIRAACQRGAWLTERLTRMTRVSEISDASVEGVAAVTDALKLARTSVPEFIEMDWDLPDPPVEISCDPSDLESAVLNLVINARTALVEAGRDSGAIRVRVVADPEIAVIQVSDNGPGMPPDVLARATEPFFTTRRGNGGSGLGLAMIAAFADRVGGTFALSSEPGEGTTATLTLPRQSKAETPPASVRAESFDLTGLRILVVEDDPQFHDVLVQALGYAGADVLEADRYAAGNAILQSGAALDLLLTDVILPGARNGLDLADAAARTHPDVPVIFLSGYADSLSPAMLERQGVFLRKPVNFTQLVNTIRLLTPGTAAGRAEG